MRNSTRLHAETKFYAKKRLLKKSLRQPPLSCLTNSAVNAIIAVQFRELDETQAERKSAFRYDFDL